MMNEPKLIPQVVTELKSEYFYEIAHQYLFKAMAYLASKNIDVDIITVKTQLEQLKIKGEDGKDNPFANMNVLEDI